MRRALSNWRHLLPALGLPYVLVLGASAGGAAEAGRGGVPYSFHDMNILGTSMDLQVAVASEQEAGKVHATALAEIERLRKILSTYDAGSDISKVNGSREPVHVAQEVIDVLKLYEQWQVKSKGAYSAGTGELVGLWKKAEKDGRAPEAAVLAAAAEELRKPLWKIDDAAKTVQRLSDVPLNIDSLGKGFIAEQAALLTRKEHPQIRGLLLNIGGDIVALGGMNLAGAFMPWNVGVADPALPADNAPPLVQLKVTSTSVATSGSYARGYKIGEKKYSHLIDPRTGEPVDFKESKETTVDSATVIAPDNATANALATSLCILSPADGLALIRATPEAQCLLVLSDGKQQRSFGFKRYEAAGGEAEGPKPAIPAPEAPAGPAGQAAAGETFPKGYEVSVDLQILPVSASNPRPYVAVWIETDQGAYVKTLGIWGNDRKYMGSLHNWWKWAKKDNQLVAMSRATRPVGKYSLSWDGTDEKGTVMPKGTYKVCIDTAFWRGGQIQSSGKIICGDQKSTGTVAATQHFQDVPLTYASKGN